MSTDLNMRTAMRMAREDLTTYVAYAVPVSLEMLGARLEAYKECRATLTTFERCIKILPRLPLEVWWMIVKEVQQSAYEEYLEWWLAANKCCKNICEQGHDEDGHPEEMMAKIIRCRKLFEDDFGLEIRLMVHYIYSPTDCQACMLLAYIVLPPIVKGETMYSSDGERKCPTFSICSFAVIDPIPEPTLKQIELFKTALKRLHLEPMHHRISGDHDSEEILEAPGKLKYDKVKEAHWLTVIAASSASWPKLLILTSGLIG